MRQLDGDTRVFSLHTAVSHCTEMQSIRRDGGYDSSQALDIQPYFTETPPTALDPGYSFYVTLHNGPSLLTIAKSCCLNFKIDLTSPSLVVR